MEEPFKKGKWKRKKKFMVKKLESGKKIAMVCHWESPYKEEWKGGMGIYMDGLSKKLSNEGLNIDFFVPKVKDYPREQEVSPGVRIIRINTPVQIIEGDIRNISHMEKFGEGVIEYVKRNELDYDLVHAQYWSSFIASKKLSEEVKAPLISQLHQLHLLKEIIFEKIGLKYEPIEEKGAREKEVIENSDRTILVSNQQLYDLEREYYGGELPFDIRRKIAVVRNAIETEGYDLINEREKKVLKNKKGIDPSSIVIGFHGRVDQDKAVDRLIYATHLLKNDHPGKKIDLSIVGRGSELTRLETLVGDLKMKDVHFYGYKTGEDLKESVKMVDIGVIPSTYETFGLSVAELMAFGVPTLVWKGSGGPEEVTGKIKPIIAPVESIIDLKNKLEELTFNPGLRIEKGAEMRKRCLDKFNWKRLIDEMKKLYSELGI